MAAQLMLWSTLLALLSAIIAFPSIRVWRQGGGEKEAVVEPACLLLGRVLSDESLISWPGSTKYLQDVHHWANSSTIFSQCSVEPGHTEDLAKLVNFLGITKTPFAVTGGGHALNPGFSSTTGIHIAMSKFSFLQFDSSSMTVVIGAGLRWDPVYELLNPLGYTVLGGRVSGVGVAGFILGGGLSWITNQYGLTIDSLVECEVVLPNGTVTLASGTSNSDLFFGLKGGFNNFGIVTRFTLKVFPQSDIWGGSVIVRGDEIAKANMAIATFANEVMDPKATMNIIFEYADGEMYAIIIMFYDAPTPPDRMFESFLQLNGIVQVASMPFLSLLNAGQPRNTPNRIQDVAPVQRYTATYLDKVANETQFWGSFLEENHSGHFFDYVAEIFLSTYYSHGSPSAWPADRSVVHFPVNIAFAWFDPAQKDVVHDALRTSVAKLRADAKSEGQIVDNASLYPNLPIIDAPLKTMYGDKGLERLKQLRDIYDPQRVMDLAGGWHF